MKSIQRSNKINRQIVGLITVIILLSLLVMYVFTSCILGDYYLSAQKRNMKTIYNILSEKCSEGLLYSEEFVPELDLLFDKYAVTGVVTGPDGNALFESDLNSEVLIQQLNYSMLSGESPQKLLTKTNSYEIFTQSYPDSMDEYLILMGVLPDSNIVFIRCSYAAVDYHVVVTRRFYFIMALFGIIIAMFISHYFVNMFTKPLFGLIDITKRISNFDFEAKYYPQRMYNEIDDLGEHVNEMSTTLKRAIEQLRKANDNLKHDLVIREETENMRKEFVANVSHELKTPIALIQGYAEGLQEGIMDDENSRQIYLDIILDEANKMNRLVREMLILNQLEAGQMNMDMVDFNLTEMIDSVVDSNRINFEAQDINYAFINKEECFVHADEFLIEQVITNFISNAIHYVLNENVITVRYDFLKKGKVRVSVFNSGNNIGKKDIKHIWEKFYKADKARSREYGGSGIGLSVVKAIMDLLHEKFGVENRENGVEFWFELSLSKDTKNKQNS